MVHNGIEYGDMQLIAEAYDILKRGLGLHEKEIADIFAKVGLHFSTDPDESLTPPVARRCPQLVLDRDHPRHPPIQRH
jgi:hypothetical protein